MGDIWQVFSISFNSNSTIVVLLRFAHQVHLRHMNYKTAKEEAEDRIHKYTNTQVHKYKSFPRYMAYEVAKEEAEDRAEKAEQKVISTESQI